MKQYQKTLLTGLLVCGTACSCLHAQAQLFRPSAEEQMQNYRQSARMDSMAKNKVLNATVSAHWDSIGNAFWYVRQTADNKTEYRLVDPTTGKNKPAFDHHKLAKALSAATGTDCKPENLVLDNLKINSKTGVLYFTFDTGKFAFSYKDNTGLQNETVQKSENHRQRNFRDRQGDFRPRFSRWGSFGTDTVSPDHKWTATIKNGNLFLLPEGGGTAVQYSTDGTEAAPYGSLAWSPDSKYLIGYHIHPVKDSNVYYVLSSVPGTTRGQLRSHPYKQPGDPFTTYEMHIFQISGGKDIHVKTDIIDFFNAPEIHWESNPQYFSYERVDRGHQRFRIIKVNALTGDTTNTIDERTKTFIYEARLFSYYLPKTHEMIRSSEKDGWQHLYLVDGKTGKEKLITAGDWVVRNVDSVDAEKREIWFSASGMYHGEDPYFIHYYRIGFDGKKLVSLTPETGNHSVHYSPDKKFLLDTYSQVNIAPVTVLKSVKDGAVIDTVEKADIRTLLATGVSLPEPFVAKGRDGQTDIYGIYFKPSHFDPHKKYPVIENIYAGPQDSFVPKSFLGYSEMQSIAELGFIVVYIDGMGTANRSKAFHDVCWKNIQDAGFPDRILWIKALAEKNSFVDTTRVGIYGTSAGGQDALCALLTHPEFYKAGVAACGCHDNRIDKQWWNEQWMGYPVGPHYAAQSNVTNAYKLQGNLLLIVGEADTNVPPETTYRVADALIKAGKDFDFLPIPGSDHTDGGPFGRMKTKDFFVRSLLQTTPPSRNNNPEFTLPKTGLRPSKVI